MDFRLTDEQLALQDAIRSYCEAHYRFDRVATLDDRPLLTDDWQRLADLDVFRLAAGVETGGLGLGVVEAAVVFEVLGNHLVPGPLVWSALWARHLGAGGGRTVGTEIVGGWDHDGHRDGPTLVEYGTDLTTLVVLRADGAYAVDPRAISSMEAVVPTDPLTPVALVSDVPAGERVGDADAVTGIRITGTVLSAALLVGLADRAVQTAVTYTRERHQFGKPIGSFQAVQHLIADMYVRASLARGATYGAAAIVDRLGAGDPSTAAASAKLLAADAAIRNARSCIQVHGGMGFTWEMIPHYLLKRSWVLEHSFGNRARHAETVASALEREVA